MSDGEFSTSQSGVQIFHRTFGAPDTACAGALLLHGLGEHGGRHEESLARLAAHGIHCRTFDWPGHGRSGGRRGHMESIDTIISLVEEQHRALRQAIGPDKPMGLLGHSMGGFFALYMLARFPQMANFSWISSPLINPRANATWLKRILVRGIDRLFPQFPISSGIKTAQCRVGPAHRRDPLMHRKLTVRLGTILIDVAQDLQRLVPQFNPGLHLLITHGSDDAVCPPEFSRALFDRLPVRRKTYHLFQNALHEPFTGPSSTEFFATLEAWVTRELLPGFTEDAVEKTKSAI